MGTIIEKAREGMSQDELAFRVGVSQGWISKVELGQIENPGAEKLRQVARALGLDARLLFAAQFDIPYPETEATTPPDVDDPIALMEAISHHESESHRLMTLLQRQMEGRKEA